MKIPFLDVDFSEFDRPYFRAFELDGKKGVIESHSRMVVVNPVFDDIAMMYDESGRLFDNVINVKEQGRWRLYRMGQGYVNSPQFEKIGHLREGVQHVSFCNALHGFVDGGGNIVLPFAYADAKSFSEGLCAVKWNPTGRWEWGGR